MDGWVVLKINHLTGMVVVLDWETGVREAEANGLAQGYLANVRVDMERHKHNAGAWYHGADGAWVRKWESNEVPPAREFDFVVVRMPAGGAALKRQVAWLTGMLEEARRYARCAAECADVEGPVRWRWVDMVEILNHGVHGEGTEGKGESNG